MEETAVIMTGMETDSIFLAIKVLDEGNKSHSNSVKLPLDYTSKNVSEKVVRIIASYVDYVNHYTWRL